MHTDACRSHVPADKTHLESPDGESEENWMWTPLRFWFCLYTLFDYSHRSGWSGWEAEVTRSEMAYLMDDCGVLNR